MTCAAKHTPYQPTEAEWRCPWCNGNHDDFYIDEPVTSAGDECDKLHEDDVLCCFKCREYITGKKFAASIQKKKGLVTCPTCKGHGVVDGKKRKKA